MVDTEHAGGTEQHGAAALFPAASAFPMLSTVDSVKHGGCGDARLSRRARLARYFAGAMVTR